jgi:hypothetical protein
MLPIIVYLDIFPFWSHRVILSVSHRVILPVSHRVILSVSHRVILSVSHRVILSVSHRVILSVSRTDTNTENHWSMWHQTYYNLWPNR